MRTGLLLNGTRIEVSPLLTNYDFDGHTYMSEVANEIMRDIQWEKTLRRIAQNKINYKKEGAAYGRN